MVHKTEYVRKYYEANVEKERERHRRKRAKYGSHKERDPLKEKARHTVNNAVAAGKIPKPTECSECGGTASVHAHHDDYSKPMIFVWLCSSCHGKRHRKMSADEQLNLLVTIETLIMG